MTLASEWERCRPWIEAALAHGATDSIADIERDIEQGRSFLLAGANSAMVCKVIETRSLHVYLAGGDLQELKSGDPALIELAKQFECGNITIMGRNGWSRALRDLGYDTLVLKDV